MDFFFRKMSTLVKAADDETFVVIQVTVWIQELGFCYPLKSGAMLEVSVEACPLKVLLFCI